MPTWDAIVLAGGRGSRLGGADKAGLVVGGRTMLGHVLHAVRGAQRVVVVGDVDAPGTLVVQERPRFGGPAAAIGAGLAEVTAPYVVVVACDQPFAADGIDALVAAATGDGAIAVDPAGRRQHLLSVLRSDGLRDAARTLGALDGRSVRDLIAPLDLHEVAVPSRATMDVDTWDDHRRANDEETAMTEPPLDDWVVQICAALGVDPDGIDVAEVLDLAAIAAHSVIRPAAPLTTFVAGLAAGRAGGSPGDVRAAIAAATAACAAQGGDG